nr:hypothetical protein CFP56_38070 [Quercus suber]
MYQIFPTNSPTPTFTTYTFTIYTTITFNRKHATSIAEPTHYAQNVETVAQADKLEIATTHKEILSDPQLFDMFITDLDHDLNYHPNSNTPNPLPQLAHAPLTDIAQHSFSTIKSTIPLAVNTDTLTTNHSDNPYPTHMPDTPKAPEPTTTPTDQTVTEKTEPLHVLGPKRKQQDVPLPDDPSNEKKQRLLKMEAKLLGKLMADNLR